MKYEDRGDVTVGDGNTERVSGVVTWMRWTCCSMLSARVSSLSCRELMSTTVSSTLVCVFTHIDRQTDTQSQWCSPVHLVRVQVRVRVQWVRVRVLKIRTRVRREYTAGLEYYITAQSDEFTISQTNVQLSTQHGHALPADLDPDSWRRDNFTFEA